MKTTIEIADDLLDAARRIASDEETTLRALVEAGLRSVIRERKKRRRKFVLEDRSVTGNGLQQGVAEGSWEDIRDLAYRGRGT